MSADVVGFLRRGLEEFYLYHDPRPYGDARAQHRCQNTNIGDRFRAGSRNPAAGRLRVYPPQQTGPCEQVQDGETRLKLDKKRCVVAEISENLHQELRKTVIINELKLYKLVNGIVEETLKDEEKLKTLLKKLKV